ncbi:MAG: type II toxin-antitoxin system VapC family toxin [Fimbriimonadales bacterium]|nr:type II toxin-antitoxin system VapC family toxin [Fimbriimonadales bacterium]
MGLATQLSGSLTYIDSSIVIYVVERHSRYEPVLQPVLDAAEQGILRLATSELTVLEVLVIPMRVANQGLIGRYQQALYESELELTPITRTILSDAAALRASYPQLRTPDAIHWATTRFLQADYFLTNDARLARIIGAQAVYLEDYL